VSYVRLEEIFSKREGGEERRRELSKRKSRSAESFQQVIDEMKK